MAEDNTVLEKARLYRFVDPLTGYPPKDEPALSALLSIFHQQGRIEWAHVKMRRTADPVHPTNETADQVIDQRGIFSCEYPLFWESKDQLAAFGSMRPDFIHMSHDGNTAVIIENKIGADLTHKGDSYGGQFGRYIKYLVECKVPRCYVILITSLAYLERPHPWYTEELVMGWKIQKSDKTVECRIVAWEDILNAFKGRACSYAKVDTVVVD